MIVFLQRRNMNPMCDRLDLFLQKEG